MPDVITILRDNVVTTQVAGADVLLPMAIAASAANAAQAAAQYQEMLDIQALGDDAAAIAARVPKNTDGSDFTQPAAVRSAIGADLAANVNFTPAGTGAVVRSAQNKLLETVSVLDFAGVDPTGAEDSFDGIQAAFDSGARKIIFPRGTYVVLGELTLPDWVHIEGAGFEPGSPDPRTVELKWAITSGAGISCGQGVVIKGLWFNSTGGVYDEPTKTLSGTTGSALRLEADATIEECSFSQWHKCIELGAGYYVATRRLQFNRCTYGYYSPSVSPYNLHIDAPNSGFTNVFLTGASTAYARNVKVFGGSIEGYDAVATHFQEIAFFGTYFESIPERTNVVAIAPGLNGSSVSLFGCLIYMDRTSRFVDLDGLTDVSLTSHGNVWDGVGQASGVCLYLPSTGTVSAAGDRFGTGHANSTVYVNNLEVASKYQVAMPLLPAGNTQVAHSGANFLGSRAFLQPLTAAPSSPQAGMMVTADGSTWDPLELADSRPYTIIYQGDRWAPAGGILRASNMAASTATDVAGVVADLNTLIARLKASNAMIQD